MVIVFECAYMQKANLKRPGVFMACQSRKVLAVERSPGPDVSENVGPL